MLDLARHAQAQFSLALLVLLVCLAALAIRNLWGRAPAPDLVIPAWLKDRRIPHPWKVRGRQGLDGALALAALTLGILAMSAAGPRAEGLARGRVLHEVIQAKYHGELGWDGLYACAWSADREAQRALGVQTLRTLNLDTAPELEPTPKPEFRIDLRGERPRKTRVPGTLKKIERPPADVGGKVLPASAAAHELDCRARFDDPRWAALGADVAALAGLSESDDLARAFEGFGTTATPARLARQRLVFAVLPLSATVLVLASLLTGALALAALVVVGRAYGVRGAALVGIVAFVEFAGSPVLSGSSIADPLVLAAVLAGLAATDLERWGLAGGLLAFAAVEAVWPSLILLGIVAKLGADALAKRPGKTERVRFAVVAGATGAALVLLSATLPGGLANWSAWAERVALHRYSDGSHQVGLRWLFAPDGSWLGGSAEVGYPTKAQRIVDRGDWLLVCAVLLLTPALLAVRRLPAPAFAAIAGVTATFAMFSVDASAYAVAVPALALAAASVAKHDPPSELLVGRPTTVLVAGTLALSVGMQAMFRLHDFAPWLFNMIYSHLLTTTLLGLGVALLLLPGLREPGDPADAPASVPVLEPGSGRAKPKPKPELAEPEPAEPQEAKP